MAPPEPRGKRTRLNNTSLSNKETSSKAEPTLEGSSPILKKQDEVSAPGHSAPNTHCTHQTSTTSASHSTLEELPVEVVYHIFSYLLRPRSRLPGLSEEESTFDSMRQRSVKNIENLESPPDTDRFAADLFAWTSIPHPFNALAASSKRCHELVERYCAHLVKTYNRFNLPFAQADEHGADSVYPSLSSIVYRRLWLQTAPRGCPFCGATLSNYPHRGFRLMLCCEDCFYAQTLSLDEVQRQYHIMDPLMLTANNVRSTSPRHEWILRIDVEALALKLYGTRAFHDTQSLGLDTPCGIPNCGLASDHLSMSSPPRRRRLPSHVTSAPKTRRRGH